MNTPRLALAAGLLGAIGLAFCTALALLGVPGYRPAAELLTELYGPYGYQISWIGIAVGAVYGFIEGAIWVGGFSLIYNTLGASTRSPRPFSASIRRGSSR